MGSSNFWIGKRETVDRIRCYSDLFCYCRVERNRTRDVAAPLARRHHRKSKFGLRHDIKLIELYVMTKSEFGFSTIRLSKRSHNVPSSVPLNSTVHLFILVCSWCMNQNQQIIIFVKIYGGMCCEMLRNIAVFYTVSLLNL